jgi:anti-sigma factor RsiW
MHCRRIQYLLLKREAAPLPPEQQHALSRHVAVCPRCAAEGAAQRRLTDALHALRTDYPFAIEVTQPVLQRVARLGVLDRNPVPLGQLGWAALVALVTAVLLLPPMLGVVATVGRGKLPQALGTLLRVPLQLLQAPVEALGVFLSLAVVPRLVQAGLVACLAIMGVTLVVVVAREFWDATPHAGRA